MKKRNTIGANPLDSVIPATSEISEDEIHQQIKKERITLHISSDLIDSVKNVVYWTPGLTLAGFAEEAFRKELASIENTKGEPFPPRKGNLKGGRPIK